MVYGDWCLRHEEQDSAKEHSKEEREKPVVHDESEAVYVSDLARYACDSEASRYLEAGLGYCRLSWPHHKVLRNVSKIERRHWTESKGFYFFG